MNIQHFLRGAGVPSDPLVGLTQLMDPMLGYNIKIKKHPRYPELYHFCYDIDSPKGNPIADECRGLILNSADNWAVVARPFGRFANHGESWAAPVDWASAKVQNKVDGSLIVMWWFGGRWNASTKGSPAASGQVGDFAFTFSELFWKTMSQYDSCSMDEHPSASFMEETFLKPLTFCFELTSIYNRVVCRYDSSELTLLAIRGAADGLELDLSEFKDYPIPVVATYPLTSLVEVQAAALALDPMRHEGYVVLDATGNRIKIKSPAYVAIHHLKDGFGQRRLIRLMQLGENSEFLSYYPEYQQLFEEIQNKVEAFLTLLQAEYEGLKMRFIDRKEFAMAAQNTKHLGVLMTLYLNPTLSVRNLILYSKKVVNKTSGEEEFQFSPEKIEAMVGL